MPKKRDTGKLSTEGVNPSSVDLDLYSVREVLELISREDAGAQLAVSRELGNIELAVGLVTESLRSGGRLFFVGAGTSGRLGVMEAAECPPTFGTRPSVVQGIIAGGAGALRRSVEGAEDSGETSAGELRRRGLRERDCVVGIAASAGTPFVTGALRYAREVGAATVLVACNSLESRPADVCIELLTGPEVLSGSTRMKAGTATKMTLNMLTTASMVRLGKTYGNLMVEVQPGSEKLKSRQEGIVMRILGLDRPAAARALDESGRDVKVAVLMRRLGVGAREAKRLLARAGGYLRKAIEGGRG